MMKKIISVLEDSLAWCPVELLTCIWFYGIKQLGNQSLTSKADYLIILVYFCNCKQIIGVFVLQVTLLLQCNIFYSCSTGNLPVLLSNMTLIYQGVLDEKQIKHIEEEFNILWLRDFSIYCLGGLFHSKSYGLSLTPTQN